MWVTYKGTCHSIRKHSIRFEKGVPVEVKDTAIIKKLQSDEEFEVVKEVGKDAKPEEPKE